MKPSRFTEEQIIGILREHKRKAKYGGMDVSDARRLKPLEDENTKAEELNKLPPALIAATTSGKPAMLLSDRIPL